MTDRQQSGRPRPQYGEYATPQQQRAHIRQPELSWPEPVAAPADAEPGTESKQSDAAPGRRPVDSVISLGLLAFGAWNVITGIVSLVRYDQFIGTLGQAWGVQLTLSDPGSGTAWGITAALTLGLGWLLTAVLTWRNVQARRLGWWIALLGGVVFTTAASVMSIVPLITDPTTLEALTGAFTGAVSGK